MPALRRDDGLNWTRIGAALAAPFPAECVEWRPMNGKAKAGARVQIAAYVDARTVQDRLDAVIGPAGWSFELEPLVVEGGELRVARGRLTIGDVSKDDIGTASSFEASKGCASDALKRAAVQWGIGRYLYALPAVWVTLDERGEIPAPMLARLRDRLEARTLAAQCHQASA